MPSSACDERVQLVVGDVADQVRPQPPAPRPHGAVDQHVTAPLASLVGTVTDTAVHMLDLASSVSVSLSGMHDHPQVRASPIFPVADLRRALAHYAALGCTVSTHDDGYGFAARAGVELHLVVVADDDPRRGPAAAYLHVPDADALAAEWADVPGTEAAGRHRLRPARGRGTSIRTATCCDSAPR